MNLHIENHMVVERCDYRSRAELEWMAHDGELPHQIEAENRLYMAREKERITAEVDGYDFESCMGWDDDLAALERRVCATPEGKAAWEVMMGHYRAMVVEAQFRHLESGQ